MKLTGIIGFILLVAAFFVVGWSYGPHQKAFSECGICGRGRHEYGRLGIPLYWREHDTPVCKWITTIGVPQHQHIWTRVSSTGRSQWFGHKIAADGGVLGWIHSCGRSELGEQRAVELFTKYRNILTNHGRRAAGVFYSDYRCAHFCLPEITKAIHTNLAFRDVHIDMQLTNGVGYWVSGTVATEEQKTELEKLIASMMLPSVTDAMTLPPENTEPMTVVLDGLRVADAFPVQGSPAQDGVGREFH